MTYSSISDLEGNRIDIKREETLTDAKIKDLNFQQCDFLVDMKNQIKVTKITVVYDILMIKSEITIQKYYI